MSSEQINPIDDLSRKLVKIPKEEYDVQKKILTEYFMRTRFIPAIEEQQDIILTDELSRFNQVRAFLLKPDEGDTAEYVTLDNVWDFLDEHIYSTYDPMGLNPVSLSRAFFITKNALIAQSDW